MVLTPTLAPSFLNNSNNTDGRSLGLTVRERGDLVAFLNLLTDSTFITDPRFSDPFKH